MRKKFVRTETIKIWHRTSVGVGVGVGVGVFQETFLTTELCRTRGFSATHFRWGRRNRDKRRRQISFLLLMNWVWPENVWFKRLRNKLWEFWVIWLIQRVSTKIIIIDSSNSELKHASDSSSHKTRRLSRKLNILIKNLKNNGCLNKLKQSLIIFKHRFHKNVIKASYLSLSVLQSISDVTYPWVFSELRNMTLLARVY